MSSSTHNDFDRSAGAIEAEKTLRLIATLPAPEGIEERVKAGLHAAPRQAHVIRWPFAAGSRERWMQSSAMRAAAEAAIVIVVAGGGWEVYSHIKVAPVPTAVAAPQPISGQGGLSTAAARRTPQTLEGPVVATPATVKQKTDEVNAVAVPSSHRNKTAVRKPKSTIPVQR